VGSLEDRLRKLEAKLGKSEWVVPLETRILLSTIERVRAAEAGEDVPAFAEDELHYLYREDVLGARGDGILGTYRSAIGWQDLESRCLLDEWQAGARRRLALVEELGDRWRDAYNHDLVEDGDLDAEMMPM
jgi:hypothetical protein